jgi:aspartate aminotransferase
MSPPYPRHLAGVRASMAPFLDFFTNSVWASRSSTERGCDFVTGNPQEMPLPAYVEAIRAASMPRQPDWFAYKTTEAVAREAVAAGLHRRLGISFEPDDVFMTKGASTALILALRTLVAPGDEVVFVSPPWFFYEAMILSVGGIPVRVRVDPVTFDLDLDAVAASMSLKTRAVIVNSPHNPTGRIYPVATLQRLADLLGTASEVNARPIYLLSDEAYNRIVFDQRQFRSPTAVYPNSLLLYSYGKTLLTPGQRLGYIALSPQLEEREAVRSGLLLLQLTDYGWPDAVLQYATPRLEELCIDVDHLQHKRDRMVAALRAQGYKVHVPEGTFYLLPRSPQADDQAFTELLAAHGVFILPGHLVEMPGFFRLSLTATESMIERALPLFAAAINHAH